MFEQTLIALTAVMIVRAGYLVFRGVGRSRRRQYAYTIAFERAQAQRGLGIDAYDPTIWR